MRAGRGFIAGLVQFLRFVLWDGPPLDPMKGRIFGVDLYDREHGPICYSAPLWQWACYLPAQLLSSGLIWYWMSLRDVPVSEQSPVQGLPEKRPWTLLRETNQQLLIDDFHERNVDGYSRYIFILGFDAGAVTGGLEKEAIEDAAAAFLEERGPVQVFIFEENDSYQEYVFVPHADKRTPAADALLRTWHLTTLPPVRTHKYSRLRIVQLENLLPFDQWDHAKSQ